MPQPILSFRPALAGLLLALAIALANCGVPTPGQVTQPLAPVVETVQVPHEGDAADDSAIWVHPSNPLLSTVIGTDKKGGLAVYDLAGRQIQYLPDGEMNNVDIRNGFSLGGQPVALVTAGNRTNDTIAIYQVNPATRTLENVAARAITTLTVYGSCMYRSSTSGFYYFVNSEQGQVQQWKLSGTSAGKVDAALVREFDVGSQTEGCVADDQLGHFYIGEESTGIWKYGAEPSAGSTRTQVDKTGSGGHLTADVEGLTIYQASPATGYLIASNQGDNSYVIYRREGANAYVATFEIVAGNGIDAVSGTDGIDVSSANLGPAFPQGMFVAQDGNNDDCNQNFKFVPWHTIAANLGLTSVDSTSQRKPANTTHMIRRSLQQPGPNCPTLTAPAPAFLPLAIDDNG
jgi:3-phytase